MTVDDLQQQLMNEFFDRKRSPKKAAGRALGVIQEVITYYTLRSMGVYKSVFLEGRLPEYNPTKPALTHNAEFTIHNVVEEQEVELDKTTIGDKEYSYYLKEISGLEKDVNEQLVERLYEGGIRLFAVPIGKKSELDFRHEGIMRVAEWISESRGQVRVLQQRPVAYVECKRVGLEEGTTSGPQTIEKAKQAAYVAGHSSAIQGLRGPLTKHGTYYDTDQEQWIVKLYEDIWNDIINRDLEVEHAIRSIIFVGNHVNWYPGGDMSKDLQVMVDNHDWAVWVEDNALVDFSTEFLFARNSKVGEAFRMHHSDDRSSGVRYFSKQSIWEPAHRELLDFFESKFDHVRDDWFRVLGRDGEDTIADLGAELIKLSQ